MLNLKLKLNKIVIWCPLVAIRVVIMLVFFTVICSFLFCFVSEICNIFVLVFLCIFLCTEMHKLMCLLYIFDVRW